MFFLEEDNSILKKQIEELKGNVERLERLVSGNGASRGTSPVRRDPYRPPMPGVKQQQPAVIQLQPAQSLLSGMKNNNIKLCPAKKGNGMDDPMLPCELYGIEVDVSQQGIWFDGQTIAGQEEELISVIRRIDKSAAATIKNLFKNPSWAEQLKVKIRRATEKAAAYAEAVTKLEAAEKKRADAELKSSRAPTDALALNEKLKAAKEFEDLAATERSLSVDAKFNITPGFVEKELPPKEVADSNGENPKGCPAAPSERMIKMEILGVELDVSPTGIWFDGEVGNREKPELVELLEKFKADNTGPLSIFKNFEKQKANFKAKIDERVALISKQIEVYNDFSVLMRQARIHPGNSDWYRGLKDQAEVKFQEFAKLSAELKKPVKL